MTININIGNPQGPAGPAGVAVAIPANTIVANNTNATANPAGITASAARTLLNINNIDNTSDLNKPVSTATRTAINALGVIYVEPTGGDDTALLRTAFATALADSKILYLSGSFTVTGELLPLATWTTGNSLKVYGLGETTITASAAGAAFEAIIVLETDGVNVIEIDNIKVIGNDKIRTGFWFRHYAASGGYVRMYGCEISGCLNSTANEENAGIVILGKYQSIKLSAKITNCRNTSTETGSAVAGITVAGYTGSCEIDCDISNITTSLTRDADGLKIFGDTTITDGNYRPQICVVTGKVKNCTGRLIKIQTSEATVRDMLLEQTTANFAQGVGVSLQWGGGLIENCVFKLGTLLEEGYTPIYIDNHIEDQKTKAVIRNVRLQCEESIPRIVVVSESVDTLDSEYLIEGITAEIASGGVCTRSVLEWNYFAKATKTVFKINNLLIPSDSPIIGYTGYSGAGDLSGKLYVEIADCRNSRPVLNGNRPFSSISGDTIKEFWFRYHGLDGYNTIFAAGLHVNFDEIAMGSTFGFYLSSANLTFENGPASLPDGTYLVESLIQWFPGTTNVVRLTNLGTGAVKLKFGATWI